MAQGQVIWLESSVRGRRSFDSYPLSFGHSQCECVCVWGGVFGAETTKLSQVDL